MKYTVEVTEGDILDGVPTSCGLCPVALALKRCIPLKPMFHWKAELGDLSIVFVDGSKVQTYDTTDAIFNFMVDFDRIVRVGPIAFELEVEEKYVL